MSTNPVNIEGKPCENYDSWTMSLYLEALLTSGTYSIFVTDKIIIFTWRKTKRTCKIL